MSTRSPDAPGQVSIQLDHTGDVQNMNSQHFSHINVSNVNKGPSFLQFLDLLSPIICAKIRLQGLFGSGEEDF